MTTRLILPRPLLKLTPLLAAAWLAGCMNLAPRYERPAAPVAAAAAARYRVK